MQTHRELAGLGPPPRKKPHPVTRVSGMKCHPLSGSSVSSHQTRTWMVRGHTREAVGPRVIVSSRGIDGPLPSMMAMPETSGC
jgi:hypothetical protein